MTEKQELTLIKSETLKEPTKSNPLEMQKMLFENGKGKLTNVVSNTKIQVCLSNLKKKLSFYQQIEKKFVY